MVVCVTGADGFLGSRLSKKLADRGNQVVALCRRRPSHQRLNHKQIRIQLGDVQDLEQVTNALAGCDTCFHLAAIAKPWVRDASEFYRINVSGTTNIVQAAIRNSVTRFVFTSTAGVFAPSRNRELINENTPYELNGKTEYERSKILAERELRKEIERNGLHACIVNPTRVFGPGPLNISNSLTRIMMQMEQGAWRFLPGNGMSVGNYVFVEDVVDGHIQAMKHGMPGQNYILGGENLSLRELFQIIQSNCTSPEKLRSVPEFAIHGYANWQVLQAKLFGVHPKITPAFARKYFADYYFSNEKAKRELGFSPMPVELAISKTMAWVRQKNSKPSDVGSPKEQRS